MKKKQLLMTTVLLGMATFFPVNLCAQQRGEKEVVKIIQKTDNEIRVMSKELDTVWKLSYRYVVSIPPGASIRSYAHLMDVLEKGKTYMPKNTLVVCDKENLKQAEEIASGFDILTFGAIEDTISAYSIRKEKQGQYDYVMIPKSVK